MSADSLRIALRADASTVMGLGHVKRCLALGVALRALGSDVRLVTRNLGVDTRILAEAARIPSTVLPAPDAVLVTLDPVPHAAWAGVGWQVDAVQTSAELEVWRPDWVLVDQYAFDARWHGAVARALGSRIAAIDDLADRDMGVALLVDQNLSDDHRAKYHGHLSPEAALLGGPHFALLDAAFAGIHGVNVAEEVGSIGVFMGGVDAGNLSCIALRACREHAGFAGPIEIVVTSGYPHAAALAALAMQWPETRVLVDLPNLAAFFARHGLQIGAGGGAAWERCAAGAPTVAVVVAANQEAVLPALAQRGAVVISRSSDDATLGKEIRRLIADPAARGLLAQRSRMLVDGLGAVRVALWFWRDSLAVRSATLDDADIMYRWRNDPVTRAVSAGSREIAWSEHRQWLQSSLVNQQRCLLVARVGGRSVGIVRFDAQPDGNAHVSLYLDPALRGLGLGTRMLLAGERELLERIPAIRQFIATVLPKNKDSARLFASCRYRLQQGTWRKLATPD
ncbi:MAG: UDP-2,4-diacetamido-2,4,6-trideoxy-beta-L-altropyranose hydrolase [Pseudomonadota bacterium]